jgi:uncharacterized protein YbaP (TraB family)
MLPPRSGRPAPCRFQVLLRCTRQRLLAVMFTGLTGLTSVLAGPLSLRADIPGSGLIWRVRDRGGTVWLAGSLHQLPEAARLPPTYELAFKEAERLVMEIDLDDLDPGAMAAELMGRALLLSSAGLARAGVSPASGVENQLLRRAVADRKPVEGLETVAFQLALFAGGSEADQLQMLDRSLADFDALPAQLQAIERAWRQGDPQALEALLQRLAPERSRPLQQRFLTRRNAAWLPRILELLRRRDDTLVVVGALHLIGEQGLVAMLRRRRLQVEPLSQAAPAAAAHPRR